MKKKYKVEVDCAACALKMEEAAAKVEGVVSASLGFMSQKLALEFAAGEKENAVDGVPLAAAESSGYEEISGQGVRAMVSGHAVATCCGGSVSCG